MDIATTIALTLGVGWASGINLYAAVLMLGFLSNTGQLVLPPDLMVVADPMVMAAAGFMYMVEFFADKVPGVDTAWDSIHTLIRIPAGAVLAAGAVGELGVAAEVAAFLIGGSLAAGSHAAKAGSRMVINTSPEPFSNWTASIAEDIAVIGGMWAALNYPILFSVFIAAFVLLLVWLLPKLWRFIVKVLHRLGEFFGREPDPYPEPTLADLAPKSDKPDSRQLPPS
ncbi:MAG TPA: DUF4126 domain-containing protein [Chromatiaceae bacterium]|jgi:hypothetical protein|nr:DUF4126 domain-containing protein [Chromatiaceae bacterium]HIN83169.1 DUF4126 domain-containing protein [Chromatiales bacterium]